MLLRALNGPQTRADSFTLPGPGWLPQTLTGPIRVSAETVLTLPTANRCVQVIADTIGSLPIDAYRNGEIIDTPALLDKLEPGKTNVETLSAIVTSLLIHGNCYGLIVDRDRLGHPTSILVINPTAVTVRQLADGQIMYHVGQRTYDQGDIMHARGLTLPGEACGIGVLEMHRRAVGQSIAAEDHTSQRWTTGQVPDGYLSVDGDLTPSEADEFSRRWLEKMGGRQRKPPVLSGGVEYKALSWSNVDLEALESRKWNALQICQMFGVPPIFAHVPSGDSKTYQNVQQDTRAFTTYTLRPWLARLEQTLTDMLPRGQKAKFNLDALLRADTKERYEAHKIGIDAGFVSPDEVREIENMTGPAPTPAPVPAQLVEGDPDDGTD